ncbi:hypothetical protein QR510_29095, partial [Escherichia coli]|uniref:hypothetical protein n=1 Tax=Escherichia coli TaxID=562 RepID=UPI0027384133
MPLVPPALALLITGASVASYKGYQESRRSPGLAPITATNLPVILEEDSAEVTQLPTETTTNTLLDGRYKVIKDIG